MGKTKKTQMCADAVRQRNSKSVLTCGDAGWLPVHHVCRYGGNSATLSLVLVPATSLCTTPSGYTPLHLLARYQASDVNIVRQCVDCNPQALKVWAITQRRLC